jgi:peroxiredoxin Q/BCP
MKSVPTQSAIAAMSLLAFLGIAAHAEPLAVGASAPQISAIDQDGKTVNLKDVYAKGPTLVYFYPKADTPGCTKQACSLRDDWSKLQEKGVQVLGVSADKPEAQKKFQQKHSLPFPLLADTDGQLAKAFGVSTTFGLPARQSFLIKDGKIAWNMPKASTAAHAADVLKAVESF